jgi:peroxiredoxin
MERAIKTVMLVSILVSVLAVAGCSSDASPAPVVQPGGAAPDFQLSSLDGQSISLGSLRGRPVMLNFWATWCGPCRGEVPFIQEVFEDEKWTAQGLVILAVNLGEATSDVTQFVADNGLTFPVLLDTGLKVARMYNVSSIPVTYFIDKNGIIKDKQIGSFSSKAKIDWRLINSILEGE